MAEPELQCDLKQEPTFTLQATASSPSYSSVTGDLSDVAPCSPYPSEPPNSHPVVSSTPALAVPCRSMPTEVRRRSLGLKRTWSNFSDWKAQTFSSVKKRPDENVSVLLAKVSRPPSTPAFKPGFCKNEKNVELLVYDKKSLQHSEIQLGVSHCAGALNISEQIQQKNNTTCQASPITFKASSLSEIKQKHDNICQASRDNAEASSISELKQKNVSKGQASLYTSGASILSELEQKHDCLCQTAISHSCGASSILEFQQKNDNACQNSPGVLHNSYTTSISELQQKNINTLQAPAMAHTSKTLDISDIQQENVSTQQASLQAMQSKPTLLHRKNPSFSRYRSPSLAHTCSFSSASSNAIARSPLSDNHNLVNKQQAVNNLQTHAKTIMQEAPSLPPPAGFYSVMYCMKKKNAKHKGPWFDGILIARGRKCTLQDTEGKTICKGNCFGTKNLAVDVTIEVGKYEVEVMRVASSEEYESGTLFTGCFDTNVKNSREKVDRDCGKRQKFVSHSSTKEKSGVVKSLHVSRDLKPKSEGSQFLQQTTPKDALTLNANYLTGGSVPIVVDQYLATKLRSHQREGVQFMYECVMGLRSPLFTGCLLADEMGLGKTVQVIALIWTLIQHSSLQWNKSHASFKRIVVVCPSSLVQNWGNEVKKWLGIERLKALVVHAGLSKEVEQKVLDFKNGKTHPLLITSYELLRKHKDLLASANPGLLVCDEAHRLKNSAGNKTISALLALNCSRRVLLTGTPVQNDLNEFYAMVDFANPNLLGPLSAFKRLYTEPIELSRDRDASDEQKQVGQARFLELQGRTKFCILRRTAAINRSYLPDKTEYLVFCQLQPLQVSLYETFVRSQFVTKLFLAETSAANVLTAIGMLRKLCNHPRLVSDDLSKKNLEISLQNCNETDKPCFNHAQEKPSKQSAMSTQYAKSLSGKLDCLCNLLLATFESAKADLTEKVVIVSNFTQTLNFVQGLCEHKGWKWLRLDGATLVADRQRLVDRFNSGFGGERVFLLSSKAGGMGLNLVGANRLILFDPDWNPATDAQAMARIWREGQKKAVIIYRLFSTGSIEEKIYQRQMVKGEIAATVEDSVESRAKSSGGRYFSREELHELFALNVDTQCDTYDLLSGRELPADQQWRNCAEDVDDPALKEAINSGVVTFVQKKMQAFENQSDRDFPSKDCFEPGQ